MTGDPHPHPNPDDGDESDDEPNDDHWLSTLLSALTSLEERDRRRTSGRHRGDRSTIDYDISIGSIDPTDDRSRDGVDEFDDLTESDESDSRRHERSHPFRSDRDRSFDHGHRDRDADFDPDRDSVLGAGPDRRTRRYRSSVPSSDHRVTTRRHADELEVTADVGGVDPDEVTVGFDDSTLVLGVSGQEFDRVDVPWTNGERSSQATIKNGVLTVVIEPATGSGTDADANADSTGGPVGVDEDDENGENDDSNEDAEDVEADSEDATRDDESSDAATAPGDDDE